MQTQLKLDFFCTFQQTLKQVQIIGVLFLRLGSKSSLTNSKANLKWRAIHDCHHCKSGYDFSFQGELNIWFYVCKEYNLPKWMEGLIFSDVVFQAATTVHNQYFSEEQKNVMNYV